MKLVEVDTDQINCLPDVPFNEELPEAVVTRYVSCDYEEAPFTFDMTGTIAFSASRAKPEFGGKISIQFSPSIADLNAFNKLENLFYSDDPPFQFDEKYTLKSALKKNLLRIKLNESGDEFVFTTNEPALTPASAGTVARMGKKVTVTVAPSFYFNSKDMTYGIFLQLHNLEFESVQAPVKRGSVRGRKVL